MDELQERIVKEYGYGVCDAYSSKHCVDRCQDHRDCGAKPISKEQYEKFLRDKFEGVDYEFS